MIELLSELLDKKNLSSSDKEFIVSRYVELFGKEPEVKSRCSECYRDAIREIIRKEADASFLPAGAVVEHDGKYYTRKSILPAKLVEELKKKL